MTKGMAERSGAIRWAWGTVRHVRGERPGVQELSVRVDGEANEAAAVAYPALVGRCAPGDRVLLNVTAVRLGLGSGGVHFVAAVAGKTGVPAGEDAPGLPEAMGETGRASAQSLEPPSVGHIVKLRYTPWQMTLPHWEEAGHPLRPRLDEAERKARPLAGVPVLLAELHSMVPVLALALRRAAPGLRVAYVMSEGGALPLAFSRHVAALRARGDLAGTVTVGHAFGGDVEAVSPHSGLLAARYALGADVAIVAMGPGIVGTNSRYGTTATELGDWVNRVAALGGVPVLVPRIQGADPRPRHVGLSHHAATALALALAPAQVPVPAFAGPFGERVREQVCAATAGTPHVVVTDGLPSADDVATVLEGYPLPVTTMGRGPRDDLPFFQTLVHAAQAVVRRWFPEAG